MLAAGCEAKQGSVQGNRVWPVAPAHANARIPRRPHAVSQTFDRPAHRHLDSTESQSESPWRDTETLMKARAPHGESSQAEDKIDRVLREKFHFRRLSRAEVDQLSESQFQRLQDEYDVARAREIKKAIRQGPHGSGERSGTQGGIGPNLSAGRLGGKLVGQLAMTTSQMRRAV